MPGFEITRKHIDLDVKADGSYLQIYEVAYKVLTKQGRDAVQKFEFSYTEGYQKTLITGAYTLKADGTKIPVSSKGILYGQGASSGPGFSDVKTISVFFPDVEIGDTVVLQTYFRQTQPWFAGQFATSFDFTRKVAAHDVRVTLTAPDTLALQIDISGLEGGKRESAGGQTYWAWTFHNDSAQRPEEDSVDEADEGPHLALGSFADFGQVASVYRAIMDDKAEVTPEIKSLANNLTRGVSNRREQAGKLYDWVSTNIAYVSLVLGAGGFTPHQASEVLARKYGDCKDHVMLLEALLKAKGIESSPVLINTGNTYRLPGAASPFIFDHLITYIREFNLFADSTARVASFGVLPGSDAGKPVIIVKTGKMATTPTVTAKTYQIFSTSKVRFSANGELEGRSDVRALGAASIDMRGSIGEIAADGDDDYFRGFLGPGASGTLDRGDPTRLSDEYDFSATYRVSDAVNFPGPAAIAGGVAYKPFFFTYMIGGNLPPTRTQSWICPSLTAEEDTTTEFPRDTKIISLPKSETLQTKEVSLQITYATPSPSSVRQIVRLVVDHPETVCTAAYYNGVRDDLAKMVAALRKQIVYQ
ncbi:MAG TPA: DUF3857 and transglutaminase domain-containing protein [Rhizomicrobium sp.]